MYGVRKAMEELGLTAKYRRAFKRTTIADPNAKVRGDLVKRQFNPPVPTTGLCGDITYLRISQGWMYLATVIDPRRRRPRHDASALADRKESAIAQTARKNLKT